MKLAYPLLRKPIEFSEGSVNVLIIEEPIELRRALCTLRRQTETGTGDFVLSEKNEILDIRKELLLTTDPFSLELDSRKISSKLTQTACRIAEEHTEAIQKILTEINGLAADISMEMEYETAFSELESPEALIKTLEFSIDKNELQILEQVLEQMRLHRAFFGKRVFAFYNLKALLSAEELRLLYKSLAYEKLNILLIEDTQRESIAEAEKMIIIDKDLCEI